MKPRKMWMIVTGDHMPVTRSTGRAYIYRRKHLAYQDMWSIQAPNLAVIPVLVTPIRRGK